MNKIITSIFYRVVKQLLMGLFIPLAVNPVSGSANAVSLEQSTIQTKVSLHLTNASFQDFIRGIESQTSFKFTLDEKEVLSSGSITINVTDESLEKILEKVTRDIGLEYRQINNNIHIRQRQEKALLPNNPEIQIANYVKPVPVTGKVTGENGEGLPGVTVLIKGTTSGTTTSTDGSFSLDTPSTTGTLVVSFIGYVTQEVPINNRTVLNITLVPDTKALDEVVVVGYGTQKRQDVTAAIASVPLKEVQDMPVSNVATAIQGKVPGVVIQQNNGAPGSTPAIKVRGFGSISAGTNPLIVVDGNIVSASVFSLLNSNEIESIDVLKDASSTAIYGSRGSNGVIIVTTKRGKAGRNIINLDVYTGFQEITKKIDLLNSQQFAEFAIEAANNGYIDNVPGASTADLNNVRPSAYLRYRYPRGDLFEWLNFDDPARVAALPYHDFQDLIFRRAQMSNYQLSASGGNEKVQYAISGGYLKQDGIIEKSTLDRYSVRANVDVHVNSKIKVGLNLNPTYKIQQDVNSNGHWADNGIINAALAAVPMAPIYSPDGLTYSSQTALAAPYNWPGVTNPVANITENNIENLSSNILGNAYGEYRILESLKYRVSGNVNLSGNRRNSFRSSRIPLNQLLPPNIATGSAYSEQGISWVVNQTLNFTKTIKEVHNLDVLIGTEVYKFQFQSNNATGSTFANDIVQTLNGAGLPTGVSSLKNENATTSYFGRVGYNYKGKYLLNASIRRDGSSIFGPENRWGTFPAGSIGWRLSEEGFMKRFAFLSETKLRLSYGLAGNNAFSNFYPYVASVGSDNYSFNNNLITGLAPSSLGNPSLGWERSQQVDAGIDLGFFNDRIYFSADYYRRITKDLLLSVNVPTVTGFGSAFKNIGKMENKGWEFALNTHNLTGPFTWDTNLNLSFNRNKVLALGPTGDPIKNSSGVGETNITQIGAPIGSFYGYRMLGIFQNQADIDAYPHDPTARPGDVKYEDVNKDGKITADDRTIIGNNQPDFIYGFTNSFSYKGFDLNISLQGVQGGEILNLSRRFFENLEGAQNQLTTVLNRWRSPENPGDGKTPRANGRPTGNNNAVSSRWVEDASYLRIQNISLGYQLPKNLIERARIQQARIYLSAQNLYTWTDYLNYNPEVSNYEGPLTGGVDYGTYPLPRTLTIGVNIGF